MLYRAVSSSYGRNTGKSKHLSDLYKERIVMAKRLYKSISKISFLIITTYQRLLQRGETSNRSLWQVKGQ